MRFFAATFLLLLSVPVFSQPSSTGYRERILQFREEKNHEFRDTAQSPLPLALLNDFEGLSYFPVDTAWYVKGIFTRLPKAKKIRMKTSTDRVPVYHVYGTLRFMIKGQEFVLQVYQNREVTKRPGYSDYLFIPFTDLTTGEQTYGGGRYLDFRIPGNHEVWLDFNLAYNPYCAYGGNYSCPVPPAENFLNVRIEAGEKNFDGHP